MKMLSIIALLVCQSAFSTSISHASSVNNYPERAVTVEVGFAPGGPTDIIARLAAQHLSNDLKQPFIVENKSGAAGNIATNNVAKAKPDGYTGLVASINITINPFMTEGLSKSSPNDLAPVKLLANAPTVLVVRKDFPAKDFQEFLAEIKANPKSYNAAAHAASPLLATTLFFQETGAEIVPVPYKGAAPAMIDLIAGHVDLSFATLGSVLPYIKNGSLRVLAVATPSRLADMPEAPTFAELGLEDFKFDSWIGWFFPVDTPEYAIDSIEKSLDKLVNSEEYRKTLAEAGFTPLQSTPASFSKIIKDELKLYGNLVTATRKYQQ